MSQLAGIERSFNRKIAANILTEYKPLLGGIRDIIHFLQNAERFELEVSATGVDEPTHGVSTGYLLSLFPVVKSSKGTIIASVRFHELESCCAILHAHHWHVPVELVPLFADTLSRIAVEWGYSRIQCELVRNRWMSKEQSAYSLLEVWANQFQKVDGFSFVSRRTGNEIHVISVDSDSFYKKEDQGVPHAK